MLLCHGSDPGAIPGSRTSLHIAMSPHPLRRWLDKQGAGLQNQIMQARYLPAVRGGDVLHFQVGSWLDKEGTCLASRFMREHYPPVPPLY